MTKEEQKRFDELGVLLKELKEENQKFKTQTFEQVKLIDDSVKRDYKPIQLEKDILTVCQRGIGEAIGKVLGEYGSPLRKLVQEVVDKENSFLKQLVSDCFMEVIKKEDFKESILNAFSHKIARTMISGNDALFDKVIGDLKSDSIFKSKITLLVSQIVEESLSGKS